jgi:hypothetical protein
MEGGICRFLYPYSLMGTRQAHEPVELSSYYGSFLMIMGWRGPCVICRRNDRRAWFVQMLIIWGKEDNECQWLMNARIEVRQQYHLRAWLGFNYRRSGR